jgi:hypothetical protein
MTAMSTTVATPVASSPGAAALAEVVEQMRAAAEHAGGRRTGWELLEVAAGLDAMLPGVRAELRARHGQLPMAARMHLSHLSRGASNAAEFGRALTNVVVGVDAPSPGSLAMHLDEWRRSAEVLLAELAA